MSNVSNNRAVKLLNRSLILKLIATGKNVSRADLAKQSELTKSSLSNIASELIAHNIICEVEPLEDSSSHHIPSSVLGRKPIVLDISPAAPYICGLFIRRNLIKIIALDLKGVVHHEAKERYTGKISPEDLQTIFFRLYDQIVSATKNRFLAMGISAIGPVNVNDGLILNPPNFFDKKATMPIVKIMSQYTKLPVVLINDANSATLAEKLYGRHTSDNFIFLLISNGIGSGFVLNNKVYNGDLGISGEIAHISINFQGPPCVCGNNGCLEGYANLQHINDKISSYKPMFKNHDFYTNPDHEITFDEIVKYANNNDTLSMIVLDEFATYISCALGNIINLLDLGLVITCYDGTAYGDFLEKTIYNKLINSNQFANYKNITIKKSAFGEQGPIYGSAASVCEKIFNGELDIFTL